MSKTTKNEIQNILEDYLGRIKATRVAEIVYKAINTETQHRHNGKIFFINEDSNGALVLTRESMVKEHIETILPQYLEKNEVQACLEDLMRRIISNEEKGRITVFEILD